MIRVAQLLHTVEHGGVETALLNWGATFSSGIDNRWYCFSNPGGGGSERPFLDAAAAKGFAVSTVPWGRWKPIWSCARRVAAEVRRHGIEVLHCHNTYANLVGLAAARMTPVKTVTTLYVWGDFGWKRNTLQWIDERLLARFDRVSAHCEQCFRDTVERGYPENRLRLLPCGYPVRAETLDAAGREAVRREFGADSGHTVLLYLARYWPEKAHDHLLESFADASRANPSLMLWMPGVGPRLEPCRALASSLGIQDRVRFPGFRPDFERLLAAADIQVHPSDNEGVALAVCAGMAAGKPMIASRAGGLPEVLRDGVSGLFVPPRDRQRLTAAILDLASNPAKAAALGREARRFITEEYSLEAATRRVEAVYREVLAR